MFISDPAEFTIMNARLASLRGHYARPEQRRDGSRVILLINNELAGQSQVAHVLVMAGNVVIRTDNVAGALGILHTRILDAIVVDLRPDLLGHEAICTLRAARIA